MRTGPPLVVAFRDDGPLTPLRPLRLLDAPGPALLRQNLSSVRTECNPPPARARRIGLDCPAHVWCLFDANDLDRTLAACRELAGEGLALTAVRGRTVPRDARDTFTAIAFESALLPLLCDAGQDRPPRWLHPVLLAEALDPLRGRVRYGVVFGRIPEPGVLDLADVGRAGVREGAPEAALPQDTSPADAAALIPALVRAGADTVLLVDNGGDVTALGAALAASGRLGAWFGVARRPIPPAVLAARVPVYLWFEPEDVVPPVVPAGRACAFVPVGVDGEDVPTATARLLALRDAGFGSLVPRFFIPVPNTREWRQLERRWGLRPGARASLDGTRPCFALSGWEPADGPELLALWTRANQPPASTPRTTTTSTTTYSLRGLSAVVDGYLANLPVRGPLHHAHDTVHALLAALPGAPPVLAPIDEYPFVAWQGQNLVHVVQRALEQRLRTVDGASEPLLRALQHAVLAGGKRIRPILVLVLTCAHDVPLEAALPAALTTEWVHSASLIQDDLPCMDDDVVRRHGASTHLRHGESLALLASDALIALAFEDLAALAAHPAVGGVRAAALVGHLARAIGPAGLVGGQAADLLAREAGRLGPADVLDVHRRKTAPLFALAADLATTLADVAPERARALRATLVEMGVAFQIIDDVLDQTPGNAAFGRPAGSDRRRGLPTLASLLGATEARRLAGRRLRPHLRVTDTDIHLHPLAQLARFVLERRH